LVHDSFPDVDCGENCPLERYLAYSGVSTICLPCGGPGGARNLALNSGLIRGEYVAFWDSDDLPILSNLQKELARDDSADVIIGSYQTENSKKGKIKLVREPLGLFSLTLGIGLWRMLFRAEFIDAIRFENLLLGEDQLYFLDVLNKKPVITKTQGILYRYVRHEHSLVTKAKDNALALCLTLGKRPRENSCIGSVLREKLELSILKVRDIPILDKIVELFLKRSKNSLTKALALTSLVLTRISQISWKTK